MTELVFKGANNLALTSSLLVAEKFGKEHKHVLDAIRNLLDTTAENSAFVENQELANMFKLIEVEQQMPVGGGVKKTPVYVMNRDGFSLLVMGFTGKKAMQFKLDYIKAFNQMEATIKASIKPKSKLEILQESVNQLVEQERRLASVEQRLNNFEKEREENGKLLLESKLSDNTVPEVSMRKKVIMLVNQYSSATNTRQQDIWHEIYKNLYYAYGISINSYKKRAKQSKLDIAEEHGFLGKMYDVISNMIKEVKVA